MAYIDFPDCKPGSPNQGAKKKFYLSEEGLTLVRQWRREGLTIEEIAHKYIDVAETTLSRWRHESDDFNNALKIGQDQANSLVEESLFRRAIGYDYDEDTWELVEGEMRKTRTVRKHVAPDVKACLSWLYSRRSDRWRATQDPIDDTKDEIEKAKKIIVAIKEVADGDGSTAQS